MQNYNNLSTLPNFPLLFSDGEVLNMCSRGSERVSRTSSRGDRRPAPDASTFQGAVDSIRDILSRNLPEGFEVKKDSKVKGGTFCKAILEVISDTMPEERDMVSRSNVSNSTKKGRPLVRYAFYPSTYHPERLGSVAIYGVNITSILSDIRRTNTFFGHKVASVSIEAGRRPFLDVTLYA